MRCNKYAFSLVRARRGCTRHVRGNAAGRLWAAQVLARSEPFMAASRKAWALIEERHVGACRVRRFARALWKVH